MIVYICQHQIIHLKLVFYFLQNIANQSKSERGYPRSYDKNGGMGKKQNGSLKSMKRTACSEALETLEGACENSRLLGWSQVC